MAHTGTRIARHLAGGAVLLGGLLMAGTALAQGKDALSWRTEEGSVALVQGERTVWQLHFRKEEGKPYFHPVTIAGSEELTALRPADHPWHRAIWWSWKMINGLNYWEEDPKTGQSQGQTELLDVKATPRRNHSARFEMALSYHPPAQPPVLTEKRILEVSAPTKEGAYRIDWTSTFTAGEKDALLDRTPITGEPGGVAWGGYAGLSLRLSTDTSGWQFLDSEGRGVQPGMNQDARWVCFGGRTKGGTEASVTVLDHPKNLRHPTTWYLIQEMPYFSPAFVYRSPYTLPAGKSLTLRYRILLQPGRVVREVVEREWRRFSSVTK